MPVAKNTTKPLPELPSSDISYPSLDKVASETAPDLAPTLETPTRPKTPAAFKKPMTPTRAVLASPTKATRLPMPGCPKTPTAPKTPDEDLSHTMPGSFRIPKTSAFDFKFSPRLEEKGRQILEEMKLSAAAIRAQMPATPSRKTGALGTAATTGRRKRLSDVHKQAFDKMDSIANHYAVKRTAGAVLRTPENPQKGMKRTKSTASLNRGSGPGTPSPVKKRLEEDPEEGGRAKRKKTEPKPAVTTSKLDSRSIGSRTRRVSGLTPRAGTARRNISGARRPLPPMPSRAAEPSVRLVPDTPAGSMTSRIPVTPGKMAPPSFAPATVGPSSLSFPPVPRHDPGTPRIPGTPKAGPPDTPTAATPGNFTFKAKAAGHSSFRALSNMHTHAVAAASRKLNAASHTPFTESTIIDDPFGTPNRRAQESRLSPTKMASNLFSAVKSTKKRKEAPTASPEPLKSMQNDSPARKKLRFEGTPRKGGDSPSRGEMARDMVAKGRAAFVSRLDALSTPKRRAQKAFGANAGAITQSARAAKISRPKWK